MPSPPGLFTRVRTAIPFGVDKLGQLALIGNIKSDAPYFGEHVKLIKTGEILKWKSYDPVNNTLEIELATGAISIVQRNEIDRISANEEEEFLLKQDNQKSSR